MAVGGNWMQRLADGMDLSTETLPGVPLVELAGDRRVLIEQYSGVSQYSQEEICVNVRFGSVQIQGNALELIHMTRERLVIAGQIDSLHLIRRECR